MAASIILCRLGRQFRLHTRRLHPLRYAIRPLSRTPGGMCALSHQVLTDATKNALPASYRDWGSPDFMRDVWNDWHKTTIPLPGAWSCEWGRWCHTDTLFDPDSKMDSRLEIEVARDFDIPVHAIEPLLYHDPSALVPLFVFAAEGRYYYYDGEYCNLWAYKGTFASHDDFLVRHVNDPNWPICGEGTVMPPEDLLEEYRLMASVAEDRRKAGETCESGCLLFKL